MQQYEIRTKDLKTVVLVPETLDHSSEIEVAKRWFHFRFSTSGHVLVLHTFETEAEADKNRLDYIERDRPINGFITGPGLRDAIDRKRQVPQPTVRVIAGGD